MWPVVSPPLASDTVLGIGNGRHHPGVESIPTFFE